MYLFPSESQKMSASQLRFYLLVYLVETVFKGFFLLFHFSYYNNMYNVSSYKTAEITLKCHFLKLQISQIASY